MRRAMVLSVLLTCMAAASWAAEGDTPEDDRAFWTLIRHDQPGVREQDYLAYLSRFPNGIFASSARERLLVALGASGRRDAAVQKTPDPPPARRAEPRERTFPSAQDRIASATQVAHPVVMIPKPAPPPPQDRLLKILVSLKDEPTAMKLAETYQTRFGGKALAAQPAGNAVISWYGDDQPTADNNALELCQITTRKPCVLVASGEQVHDVAGQEPRNMPRVTYHGPFRSDQVPLQGRTPSGALAAYATLPTFKAIAIAPQRDRLGISVSARTQLDADTAALKSCNDSGKGARCILYASGMEVVFPKHLTQASTRATASR
ncbi:MAG: hypothetical protein AB7F35_26825 [Acetobacteraceae bacterium]